MYIRYMYYMYAHMNATILYALLCFIICVYCVCVLRVILKRCMCNYYPGGNTYITCIVTYKRDDTTVHCVYVIAVY